MSEHDIATWIGRSEAARRLTVSVESVRQWVRAGRLRAIRTRLGMLIDPESVEALRVEREQTMKKG